MNYKSKGWRITILNPRVNSVKSGLEGRLGLLTGNRHVNVNKRTVSSANHRKNRYKHRRCEMHTLIVEVVMKHLLVVIQYTFTPRENKIY